MISFIRNDLMNLSWLGKIINENNFSDFVKYCENNKIDLCGENGEFHTITLYSPNFMNGVNIGNYEIINENNYSYLSFEEVSK